MTESTEMYLLRIALLAQGNQPVPISQLAETLDVSPISANQMCRKLEARGFVRYQPYKGVTLTPQGEAVALRVLRKRRLWEVFLAEKLGLDPEMAETIACRFEHVTPGDLAEKLAEFLGHPVVSPQQQPIPPQNGHTTQLTIRPLTSLSVGQWARIFNIDANDAQQAFLRMQHIGPGTEIKLLAVVEGQSMLLEAGGQYVTLSFDIAQNIQITSLPTPTQPASSSISSSL